MAEKRVGDLNWPDGWWELQERAQNEKDPRKLEAIISEMKQLLCECEKKDGC